MMAPTHKVVAVGWILVGNIILHLKGQTEVNYYLSMIIMLQIGKYGALFPDIDHHWSAVKEKTVPNWIINKLIHITGGKHRSWQTHSLDIAIIFTIISFLLPSLLYEKDLVSKVNMEVLYIVLCGFCLGWLSHLFADMLTNAGARLICWSKFKVAFVPKQIFGLRFNTGNEWEQFIYSSTKVINAAIGLVAIIYPLLFTEQGKVLIDKFMSIIS